MAKRRKRNRPRPRIRPPRPVPIVDVEPASERVDITLEQAERAIRDVERTVTGRANTRIEKAFRALDRAIERTEQATEPRTSPGIIERVRRWRRQRKQSRMVRRLERGLQRRGAQVAEKSSAALLAVLVEKIARLDARDVDPRELTAAMETARQVGATYDAFVQRLRRMRDSAHAEVARSSELVQKATIAREEDLAARWTELAAWARREREASAALARCEAARERIADALEQLASLADRVLPERG